MFSDLQERISESSRRMNKSIDKTLCFTGHRRVIHSGLADRIKEVISLFADDGFEYFISGGALGFDMLAASCVVEMKKKYNNIKLIIAVPCRNQASTWSVREKQAYEKMLGSADEVIVMSEEYYRGCMHNRNRYMVDNSAVCVCYAYKNTGGTSYTVNYARKKGKTIVSVI